MSKYADIQLVTTSERESVRHPESVARRIAQLSVIDALCVAVSLRRTDRAYILETGEITKTGTGAELLADPAVKHAYLGVG